MNNSDVKYLHHILGVLCGEKAKTSYTTLMVHLYSVEFIPRMEMDKNRISDAIDLRRNDFIVMASDDNGRNWVSVLEMMYALATRIENAISYDPVYGDRRSQWFWEMIVNLGLGGQTDDEFDVERVDDILNRFIDRDYNYNGKGGLFVLSSPREDMAMVDIWTQANWYLTQFYKGE